MDHQHNTNTSPMPNPSYLSHFHHFPHFPSNAHEFMTNTIQEHQEEEEGELGAMKEMMYRIAAMQPVDIDPVTIKKPKRRNVRISEDPQSIAARHRRERISERVRILQQLVPGGTKMDTASMLDEAILYVKFLKRQVEELQAINPQPEIGGGEYSLGLGFGLISNGDGPSDIGKFN